MNYSPPKKNSGCNNKPIILQFTILMVLFFALESYAGCDSNICPSFIEGPVTDYKTCSSPMIYVGTFTGNKDGMRGDTRLNMAVNNIYIPNYPRYTPCSMTRTGYHDNNGIFWRLVYRAGTQNASEGGQTAYIYGFYHNYIETCPPLPDQDGDGIPDDEDLDFLKPADRDLGFDPDNPDKTCHQTIK